jgi:hypothetical protein
MMFAWPIIAVTVLVSVCCGRSRTGSVVPNALPEPCKFRYIAIDIGEIRVPSVKGKVTLSLAEGEMAPVPDVVVSLARAAAVWRSTTDKDGSFAIDVPPGHYFLETCREGLESVIGRVTVAAEATPALLELRTTTAR